MVKVTVNRQGRILEELSSRFSRVKRKKGGITAKEYAKKEGIHRNTAKSRLDKLVEENVMYSEWSEMEVGERGNGETVYYLLEDGENNKPTKEIIR